MIIDADVCLLRPWSPRDLADLVRHANNPRVACNLRDRFPQPYTEVHARAWLEHATGPECSTDFAITVRGRAVGGIGYIPGEDVERFSAEIGYWIGEDFWGRGIGTAAVRALADHLFSSAKLFRLFANAFAGNLASHRVLEKAGFACEGRQRWACVKGGVVLDELRYARVSAAAATRLGFAVPPETRPV